MSSSLIVPQSAYPSLDTPSNTPPGTSHASVSPERVDDPSNHDLDALAVSDVNNADSTFESTISIGNPSIESSKTPVNHTPQSIHRSSNKRRRALSALSPRSHHAISPSVARSPISTTKLPRLDSRIAHPPLNHIPPSHGGGRDSVFEVARGEVILLPTPLTVTLLALSDEVVWENRLKHIVRVAPGKKLQDLDFVSAEHCHAVLRCIAYRLSDQSDQPRLHRGVATFAYETMSASLSRPDGSSLWTDGDTQRANKFIREHCVPYSQPCTEYTHSCALGARLVSEAARVHILSAIQKPLHDKLSITRDVFCLLFAVAANSYAQVAPRIRAPRWEDFLIKSASPRIEPQANVPSDTFECEVTITFLDGEPASFDIASLASAGQTHADIINIILVLAIATQQIDVHSIAHAHALGKGSCLKWARPGDLLVMPYADVAVERGAAAGRFATLGQVFEVAESVLEGVGLTIDAILPLYTPLHKYIFSEDLSPSRPLSRGLTPSPQASHQILGADFISAGKGTPQKTDVAVSVTHVDTSLGYEKRRGIGKRNAEFRPDSPTDRANARAESAFTSASYTTSSNTSHGDVAEALYGVHETSTYTVLPYSDRPRHTVLDYLYYPTTTTPPSLAINVTPAGIMLLQHLMIEEVFHMPSASSQSLRSRRGLVELLVARA